MNDTEQRIYAKHRRKGVRASTALRWARQQAGPTKLDWTMYENNHIAVGRGVVNGVDVRVVVDHDEYRSYEYGWTDKDTGIRNRDYVHGDSRRQPPAKFIELESGYTVQELAADYRKQGMSKSVALDAARESLTEEYMAMYRNDIVLVNIAAHLTVNGVSVGYAGVGADVDATDAYVEHELDFIAEDVVSEAMDEARENLPAIIETQRKALDSLTALW